MPSPSVKSSPSRASRAKQKPNDAKAAPAPARPHPRIYYIHHPMVGRLEAFAPHLDRASSMGFDTVLISPIFAPGEGGDVFVTADHDSADRSLGEGLTAVAVLQSLATACGERGLKLFLDLALDRFAAGHPLAVAYPDAFTIRRGAQGEAPIDPRRPVAASGQARPRLNDPPSAQVIARWADARIAAWTAAGVAGFRVLRPDAAPPAFWRGLIDQAGGFDPPFLAEAQGVTREAALALATAGFDALTSSLPWWDFRSPWFVEEYEALRLKAPLIAAVEAPFGPRSASRFGADWLAGARRTLAVASATGSGLLAPMGFEFGAKAPLRIDAGDPVAFDQAAAETAPLQDAVRAANGQAASLSAYAGEMRLIGGGAAVTALLRANGPDLRTANEVLLTLINPDLKGIAVPDPALLEGVDFGPFQRTDGGGDPFAALEPGEVRLLTAKRARPVKEAHPSLKDANRAAASPRLVIEGFSPSVDGGAFPVKRVVGEQVVVEADVFADGHEQLAVELQWRSADEDLWQASRMTLVENDRWRGVFPLERLGRSLFRVEAWLDRFGGFQRDFRKKVDAGVAQATDLQEGRALIEAAAERCSGELQAALRSLLEGLEASAPTEGERLLLDPQTAMLMEQADDRPFRLALDPPQMIDAERLSARFASWYELFPRSQTDDASRHGTFEDVIKRLPAIRAMGFDVLYFPPIHPIGLTNRKGRNNSLSAGPDDPGSPYAIGSKDGGHDAIHPELGNFESFRRLIKAADEQGLEIALDFAVQCSPDHPWLKDHPGWFAWRSDGTIKYAENPPKKYEDIVNVDFYADAAIPDLWVALRDVVLLWIGEGVKTFRVDNPHTKPLPFWEWMIGEVRGRHPEVIFLAEAFTRPKMMYRLAKIGFSQSYSYFTWRHGKAEFIDYLTELTTEAPKDFYRPNFFVNTPDINPYVLQTSGRSGFLIRAALAATLSGLWGVYSGFELLEADPIPGKEEYKDSEKYEIKPRDWNAPGNIIPEITRLNRIRKAHPALQTHLGVAFHEAWNDNILLFSKGAAGRQDRILVAINLDPHNAQGADIDVPLWMFGLLEGGALQVEDLLHETAFVWRGQRQHVWLGQDLPYAIWRITPEGRG